MLQQQQPVCCSSQHIMKSSFAQLRQQSFLVLYFLLVLYAEIIIHPCTAFVLFPPPPPTTTTTNHLHPYNNKHSIITSLYAVGPLQPAAILLMDSGKALARSGEVLIDLTSDLDMYGSALSSSGAFIRNAGDCIAQAAASCRFKTALELICDELREAATCLLEGSIQMNQQVTSSASSSSSTSTTSTLDTSALANCVIPLSKASVALEGAGRSIMQGATVKIIGEYFVEAANELKDLSCQVTALVPTSQTCALAGQRMAFGADQMKEAGYALIGKNDVDDTTTKGKQWIKQQGLK